MIEPGTTPSIPLQTSELIVHYSMRVPSVQPEVEGTLYIPIDTTGWFQTSEKTTILSTETLFPAEGTSISSLTGTASLLSVMPKDKHFPVHLEIAMPINRHMTCLVAEVALHNALALHMEELSTAPVPGIALKGALFFAETSTISGRDSRASTPSLEYDVIAGIPLADEVGAFASIHGLRSYLADSINLVRRSFSSASDLRIEYEHDDETDGEWLSVTARVSGDVDQLLDEYDSYTRHFNRLVPWPTRSLIRFNYDIT